MLLQDVSEGPISLRVRWAIPPSGRPVEDVWVRLADERLVEVAPFSGQPIDRELPDSVLVPAAANAHVHLELSSSDSLRPTQPVRFSQWLDQMIAHRRNERSGDQDTMLRQRWQAVGEGIERCRKAGVTWVADIVSSSSDMEQREGAPVSGIGFVECIGLVESRIAEAERMLQWLPHSKMPTTVAGSCVGWSIGLSPHAPYSVHPRLFETVILVARRHGLPVAMHLAESEEEMRLLRDGAGPLVDVLRKYDAWQPGVLPFPVDYAEYINALSRARRSLLIHGNYLEPPHWDLLAVRRDRMAVVYCPRTHASFTHRPYPLTQMLAAGVRVLLGTDSLATNPDLNVWREVAFCHRHYPEIAPARLLAMVTSDVWQWRGVTRLRKLDSLGPNELAVFPLSDASDPWSFLELW